MSSQGGTDNPLPSSGSGPRIPHGGDGVLGLLGDFELLREIGRGGMGTVYEARERALDRTVAVKVLNRHVSASPIDITRFKREAQAAAKLHHPHIVPIFAQGEEDGIYYYAMELVDGHTIGAVIQTAIDARNAGAKSLDLDETVVLSDRTPKVDPNATTVAVSTVSPSPDESVMDDSAVVVSTDSRKTSTAPHQAAEYCQSVAQHIATIADAIAYAHEHGVIHRDIKPHNLILGRDGRVRVADFGLARLEEQPGVTVTGEFLGSPLYMSAEQITGGSANVDHRTDIYSLGATMYEWLTLAPPFPGKTREQVISKIVNAEPMPPRVHNPAIPIDLETICLRAIARDRNRRYQTASAMRDDLHCYLAKRPIHARRDGAGTRAAKFARRHPFGTFAATTGAAAAIIVVTLGWALWTTRTEVRQQTAAAEAAKQETNEILDLVSSLPPEVALLFRGAKAIPPVVRGIMGSDEPAAKANNKPKRKGANAAAVRTAAGLARRGAVEFYVDMAAAAGPANTSISVPPESLRTAFDERATDPAHAKQLVDELLAANADDFDALQLHAVLLLDEHKYDAVAADAGLLVRLRPASFVGYLWRGLAGMLSGNTAASRDHFARAVELDANSAWAQTLYGLSATDVGLMDEAVASFDRALDLVPQLPVAILGRAVVYAATGQLDAAIAEVTRVLHQEPDNADAFAARGEYYSENGDYYNAARDISRAMELGGPTTALVAQYLALISRRGGPINPDVSDEEPSKTDEVEIGKVETETDSARNRESGGFTGLARAWLARMLPYRPERPVDTAGGHSQSLAPCDTFESRQTHVPLPSIRISRLFGSRHR